MLGDKSKLPVMAPVPPMLRLVVLELVIDPPKLVFDLLLIVNDLPAIFNVPASMLKILEVLVLTPKLEFKVTDAPGQFTENVRTTSKPLVNAIVDAPLIITCAPVVAVAVTAAAAKPLKVPVPEQFAEPFIVSVLLFKFNSPPELIVKVLAVVLVPPSLVTELIVRILKMHGATLEVV